MIFVSYGVNVSCFIVAMYISLKMYTCIVLDLNIFHSINSFMNTNGCVCIC
jgi:hypothetical protein